MNRKVLIPILTLLILTTSCFDTDIPETLISKQVAEIDAYLLANVNDYIAYDASGIRIVIHEFGQLAPPHLGQTVKAVVTGSLFSDGSIFSNESLNKKLDDISIVGLRYAISALMTGSKATVYIPSEYGYGASGTTGVPANSILEYEIDLTETVRTAAEQTRFEADTAAINDYLIENEIDDAIFDDSGIVYTLDELGGGPRPKVYDAVSFTYSGKLLAGTTPFDAGTLTNRGIFSFIDGFKLMLPQMNEGTTVTVYIPSGLGYGSTGTSSIPANSNLVFEIKLTEVPD